MTGKEFLEQYAIIDREIKAKKIQIDSYDTNLDKYIFVPEIALFTDELKDLAAKSIQIKKDILDKIQRIDNAERRQIFIKKYIELKRTTQTSKR